MKFFRIILYVIVISCCNCASAQNIIKRTAEYAPEMPDTFYVKYIALSNGSKISTQIYFQIKTKNKAFKIYSAKEVISDSIVNPLEPFTLTHNIAQNSDSLIIWECAVAFPYRAVFYKSDRWIVDTSVGLFSGSSYFDTLNVDYVRPVDNSHKQLYIISAIILACLLFSLLLYYNKFQRKKTKDLIHLGQHHEYSNTNNTELDKKIKELYSGRWEVFNRLCDEYFNIKDAETDKVRLSVHKELERQINDFRSAKSLAELEQLVNTYNDNIITRIRTQIPKLSNKDIAFITYLYAGFSPKAICLFTDSKIKNFYNRRTRLRDRILESNAPDCEEFSSKMQLSN
ncbi:MAG: hypothetical protein HDS50_04495 [Bacteroides sp.]|nr:hypothetical protein [Bacteroides sp.]